MANMLVDQLAGDFDPSEFEDDYAIAVKALVRAKIEGGEVASAPPSPSSGEVVDLLAALARSVEKAKATRGEGPRGGEESSGGSARRASTKKTTAKKTTAKKAPAKKAAPKKTEKKAS